MALYNDYYLTENLFGEPSVEIIEFFETLNKDLIVLDLGCGQGRDSIAIGKLGFQVLGIDNSTVGINQLNKVANEHNLNVKGKVDDIYFFDEINKYNVVLLDSIFHFWKNDLDKETEFITRILEEIKPDGYLCVNIQDNNKKVQILKKTIKESNINHKIILEKRFAHSFKFKDEAESITNYCFYVVQKLN